MPNPSALVSCPRRSLYALILSIVLIIACPRPVQQAHAAGKAPIATVVTLAHALIGAPYAYIGDDPKTGFSCIGFVHYLYGRVGIDVPYELNQAYAANPHVDAAHLQAGDLVFFSNTVWNGLSHVGLYVGSGKVIGADNYTTGVEMTRLADPYWRAHYTGATRPIAGTVHVPVVTSPGTQPITPLPQRVTARPGEHWRGSYGGDVYSGPGYAYPRIDHLPARTLFVIVRLQGTWANVVYHTPATDYYGWVDAPYLAACALMK